MRPCGPLPVTRGGREVAPVVGDGGQRRPAASGLARRHDRSAPRSRARTSPARRPGRSPRPGGPPRRRRRGARPREGGPGSRAPRPAPGTTTTPRAGLARSTAGRSARVIWTRAAVRPAARARSRPARRLSSSARSLRSAWASAGPDSPAPISSAVRTAHCMNRSSLAARSPSRATSSSRYARTVNSSRYRVRPVSTSSSDASRRPCSSRTGAWPGATAVASSSTVARSTPPGKAARARSSDCCAEVNRS